MLGDDLAAYHEPVSDFLSLSGDVWPVTPEAEANYRLSDEQVASFARDGFIDNWRVVNDAQVERLRLELDTIMDPSHPSHRLWHEFNQNEAGEESGKHLFHALGAWRIAPSFHDLLFHPAVLVPASQLLGNVAVRLWHDQLFCKRFLFLMFFFFFCLVDFVFSRPKTGACVAWHQDFSYWTRTTPMQVQSAITFPSFCFF
jgi:hypothetical protein